jgi:hypothetical protein
MAQQDKDWLGELPANAASAVTKIGDCGVHSNDDGWNAHSTAGNDHSADWNGHSIELVDPSAGIIPTNETYAQLQKGYDYFNWHLFENTLPNCLITLQRRGRTYGYYAPDRFGRKDGHRADEIALNPQYFRDGTEEILSTLIHEMVHLWQHHDEHQDERKPGRGGYHNRQWAGKMRSLGLQASNTGKEGGKETGDAMDHYVLPDGLFARTVQELLASGFEVTWIEVAAEKQSSSDHEGTVQDGPLGAHPGGRGSLSGKRTKYSCPHGDLNAWAKPGADFLCGRHREPMRPASDVRGNSERE